jgi:hypothetical protein
MHSRSLWRAVLLGAFTFVNVIAQTNVGQISGKVFDSSGPRSFPP